MFRTIDDLEAALRGADYLPDRGLATALFLATRLEKPVLLEGEAGVGKTEAAKALARVLEARLIRLQCYEGLDVAHAVYEWNYARQLLHIRAAQEGTVDESELFGPDFLIRRPLIDEIDRADEEFEAFLLEVLSDFQITVPELGTIAAKQRPHVILTSNRTRELHDALKRRCRRRPTASGARARRPAPVLSSMGARQASGPGARTSSSGRRTSPR